jgi:HlyD family secretion protein
MRRIAALAVVVAAALIGWGVLARRNAPPEVAFARATRQRIESTLATNGKVEPFDWADVRAERDGLVARVPVDKGRQVAKGDPIAEMETREARADVAAAEARIAQIRAELELLQRGGRSGQISEIESALARALQDRDVARREYEGLSRLESKKAATRQDVAAARERLDRAELEIRALESKRATLVDRSETEIASARLRDAQLAADAARRRIEFSILRAPMDGVVYSLEVRPGAWLHMGDPVAQVGRLDQLKVIIYVDEPELGRVAEGMPVTITWDARPGRQWTGAVQKVPTQISTLGTRQIGEVISVIQNPGRELLPGTNVNVEIRSKVVEHALTIPKEALRRRNNEVGVLLLQGDQVVWRPVKVGASSITRTEVLAGLSENDAVAVATETEIEPGRQIRPVFPG